MALSREHTSRIIDILGKNPQGLSITDIVKLIDLNRNTAGRYLENLLVSGQVEMRHFGMAKIYALSNRTPQSAMLSISSDLIMQLDSSLRIVFANEPFLNLLRVTTTDLFGKNFEYSAAGPMFEEALECFIAILKSGIAGKEWHGTLLLNKGDRFFSCHVTPAVFNDGRKGVSIRLEDLTELRHREHALQESEARLRSIISASPAGIGVVLERVILEVNNRFCQMTGYKAGELLGRSTRFLYPTPEEFERVGREKNTQMDQTGTSTIQTRWKKKDGSLIDVLISSALLDPADLKRGITFTALDITKRTRAERELRENEERYRQLAEVSNDLIFVINRDDRVEYVNSFAAAVLNKPAEEIVGSLRTSLFPADVAGLQTKQISSVFETGVPAHSEGPLTISHRICWFDHFLMPLKDPDGSVRSVLGVSRDLTDRIRAEKALRESEQNYRGVIENLQDVFYRVDNTGRIIMASPSATGIFGYDSVNEILGKNLADLYLDPKKREEFLELMKKNGSVKNFEVILKRKDGSPVIVSTGSHYYRDADGTILGIEGITKDITELKRTEEELFNSRQMLQLVLDTIPVRVFWKDLNSVYLGCNRPFALDAGSTGTEILIGKTDYDTAFAKTADLYRSDDREVMETGSPKLHYEEPHNNPDGSTSWLRTSKVPLRNREGKVIGVLGTYEDITERKRMEAELNAGAERYEQLAECSLDAVVIADLSSNVIMTNHAALTLFEIESHEVVHGGPVFRFVAPESLENARRDFATMSPERKPIMQTYTGITARGKRVAIEALGHQILHKGRYVNIISIRDISRRTIVEEDLKKSEQMYRNLADNSIDIINHHDADFNLTYVSPAIKTILGYEPEDAIGRCVLDFVNPEDIPAIREIHNALVRKETDTARLVYRMVHKDGHLVWLESTVRAITNPLTGEGAEFYIVTRDITLRKNAEVLAHRRDRLLHGFATASGFLLTGRIKDPIPRVLATIGEALRADIAYLCQDTFTFPSGSPMPVRKFHWAAKTGEIGSTPSTHHLCGEWFSSEWAEKLSSGAWVTGTRRKFSEPIRQRLEVMGIQSVLIVPVHVKNTYWGFIGFSDTRNERIWSDTEIGIIMTLAAMIGIMLGKNSEGPE